MVDKLPPIDYTEIKLSVPPPARRVPSRHIQFNSLNIEQLGLKDGSTWKDQTEELKELAEELESEVKRVLWIRHGEGSHNAAERDFGKEVWEKIEAKKEKYFDPDLNEAGFEQARRLGKALDKHLIEEHLKVDLIIVSPLTRAIRTAELAFASVWDKVPIVAVEMARERHGKNICDRRRPVTELKAAFPKVDFDHFMVADGDVWHTERREDPMEVRERVKRLIKWIMQIPHSTIAVVGHSDFMSHAVEVAGFDPHWPANCELVPMVLTADGVVAAKALN